MKIVINDCFGGFGLSPIGIKRLAELKGRPCYFFRREGFRGDYIPMPDDATIERGISSMMLNAFDIPNPNEVLDKPDAVIWNSMTMEERAAHNKLWSQHMLDRRPDDRTDPDLVRVVEELGSAVASGACSKLKVIEIPDGVEWEIDEYDGAETVDEKHRSWG